MFEPLSMAHLRQPYDAYSMLRDSDPLLWHEGTRSWVISRFVDCDRVLRDWSTFASDFRRVGWSEPQANVSIQTTDPPKHTALREKIVSAWRRQDRARIALDAARWLSGRIETRLGRSVDLVEDLCIPYVSRAVSSLLGCEELGDSVAELSARVVSSMFSSLEPGLTLPGVAARSELAEVLHRAARTTNAGLLGVLRRDMQVDISGEVSNSARVVMLAGLNSTQRLLGLASNTVLSRRSMLEYGNWNSLVALNELVRYDSPFQATARLVTKNVEFAGTTLRSGDEVTVLVGSANRDPRVFVRPDSVDLGRRPNDHIAFGRGVHACFGAGWALQLLGGFLVALRKSAPRTTLIGEARVDHNPTLRGFRSLPVLVR